MKYQGISLRHEYKFYINKKQYLLLKNRIKNVMRLDPNSNENGYYTITSLYLEDYQKNAYFEKEDGIYFRKKYRIRSYDYKNNVIKLEKKIKLGKYIGKASEQLSFMEYKLLLKGKGLRTSSPLLSELRAEENMNRLRPSLLVEYDREAYIYKEGNVRVTFDMNLRYGNSKDNFDPEQIYYSCVENDKIILEVKFDSFIPAHIRSLLQMESFEQLSISKYVICANKKERLRGR